MRLETGLHVFSTKKQTEREFKSLSSALTLDEGIPQGFVLSASLFYIFINDRLESNFNDVASAFADGVVHFHLQNNIQNLFVSENIPT